MPAASQQPASVQRPPEWGIQPVPPQQRVLGFLDQAVLWGNLGISLLVLVAGALLVPALGLWSALAATVVGAAIGNALLGLAAVPASQTGVPTMVLYRAPLGLRGSLLPTACNVVQNLGWATFELFVIAAAATEVSERVFGFRGRLLWVLVFGAITTAMAVAGPLTVIRRWLERFAVWAVLASTAYLTWYALTRFDLGALARRPGQGGLSFWAGVDIAIALPVSWVPLVADYARFGRSARATFWGTGAGYFLAQVWFYALGVLFLLGIGHGDVIAAVVAVPAGLLAMAVLVVDEGDEVFANLYSAGVSLQNAVPRLRGRHLPGGPGRRPGPLRELPVPARGAVRAPVRGAGGRLLRAGPPPLRRRRDVPRRRAVPRGPLAGRAGLAAGLPGLQLGQPRSRRGVGVAAAGPVRRPAAPAVPAVGPAAVAGRLDPGVCGGVPGDAGGGPEGSVEPHDCGGLRPPATPRRGGPVNQ